MQPTMRWFGTDDPVSLSDIKQSGATGVVTALHNIPHGELWPSDQIEKRKQIIEAAGLSWPVVESVNIHESIKTRSGNYKQHIENYKQTVRNLAQHNVRVVTYNFMPVNDWTRTSLNYTMPDGSKALYFNWFDLAVFDVYVLKRKNAADNYQKQVLDEAEKRFKKHSKEQLDELSHVVRFGIPGEKKSTVEEMRSALEVYDEIDHATLRENLKYFLQEVAPVAEEANIKLAIHPDDPPFDIFGLPRIVCNADDLNFILQAADNVSNGICFCTGSLGANAANNLPAMIKTVGKRLHFAHLRNTKRDAFGNFFEDNHLDGDTDMYAVMKEIVLLMNKTGVAIPVRPDHGHQMLDDLKKKTNPGYSAIGRLRGLAELRGLELGIARSILK